MGFLAGILNFLIFGSFIYSIVLSMSEAKKSQTRKQKRSTTPASKQEEYMLGKVNVEKKRVSRTEYAKMKQYRNRQQQTAQERPQNYERNTHQLPPSSQSIPEEVKTQEKITTKLDKKNASAYSLKRRPKKKLASTFLNRQSLTQAMIAKEILDKPLSIRNRKH